MPTSTRLWTTDPHGELLPQAAWVNEGMVCKVVSIQAGPRVPGAVPVYRFVAADGNHFWTTDPSGERLPAPPYHNEGPVFCVLGNQAPGAVPLYRWHDPGTGDHFWTTDAYGELLPQPPYVQENLIVGYVFPPTFPDRWEVTPLFRWSRRA